MENLKIIYKKIEDIEMYDNNPRKNSDAVQYVMNSIQQFGFKVPIIIDKNNVIVCGHTRYKAARRMRMNEVPCIVADDLTDEQIKVFRLADNKVAEMSGWDYDKLEMEMGFLDPNEFDLADFGFFPQFNEVETEDDEEDDTEDNTHDESDSYNIIIPCDDLNEQREMFERLTKMGIACEME